MAKCIRVRGSLAIFACLMALAGEPGGIAGGAALFAAQPAAQSSGLDRARAAMREGQLEEAIALLKSRLKSSPRDAPAKVLLGDAYLASRQPAQAEAEFTGALQISPGDFRALLELGSFYADSGQLGLAEPLLARAVRERPSSSVARIEWAIVLAKLHRYSQAAAALQGVSAPDARDHQIAYERLKASIDVGMGNFRAAAADMERALERSPGDEGLQLATGIAENHAGAWTRAVELLQPIFASTRSPKAGLALLEARIGARQDYRPTLDTLRTAAAFSPEELSLRLSLAQILTRHNLYAEAAEDFERAVSLGPGRAELLYDLALAQFRAGAFAPALESGEKAKTIEDSASLESLLGEIEEQRGDSLAAVHSLQSAVALDPGRESYRLSLGLELLRHDTFEPALVVFEQGAALFPKSLRMRVALGVAYYCLQEYPDAIKALVAGTTLGPDPYLAVQYLGRVLLEVDKPDPAAVDRLCRYADRRPGAEEIQASCGALLARVAHDRGETPPANALRRLRLAAGLAPDDSMPRCELGKALAWKHQWSQAQDELEACVRLEPDSVEGHYVLAGIYRRLGQQELAAKEIRLHDDAARRMADANGLRERTLRQFLNSPSPR